MPPKREELTKTALAARFGVEVRTITNWMQAGMPHRMRSGRPLFVWHECYAWREQAIREDGRAKRESGDDEERQKELRELKLRRERAATEREELALAELRKVLVPVSFMEREFERLAQALRARLLSIPSAWAPRLGACTTTPERQLLLSELVNELLPLLGDAVGDPEDEEPEAEAA